MGDNNNETANMRVKYELKVVQLNKNHDEYTIKRHIQQII